LALDEKMRGDDELRDDMSGTTAVIVLIKDQKIYCGNVGDSRAVASVCGTALPLSFDHKPANENEARRIIAAGGWVEFNRVNGNLALSRALGDFAFKKNDQKPPEEQIVTACPDVIVRDLTYNHEFIILACDGIWDVMSNQEVVEFCRDRLAAGREPEAFWIGGV
uniref:protein-serine/threonine phosphatase n=1 Tax=Gongylonema pulchrum TaxID=637853 RepID=A0A183EST0_9BILA